MPNILAKKRPIDDPYAIFEGYFPDVGNIEHRVLKTYKLAKNEDKYSRWLVGGKSDATHRAWEYGDMYAEELMQNFRMTYASPEFETVYADYIKLGLILEG